MELQEMGVDGQGNTEPGESNDDKIFFMKYPLSDGHHVSRTRIKCLFKMTTNNVN
jgi:hypothetical protein